MPACSHTRNTGEFDLRENFSVERIPKKSSQLTFLSSLKAITTTSAMDKERS